MCSGTNGVAVRSYENERTVSLHPGRLAVRQALLFAQDFRWPQHVVTALTFLLQLLCRGAWIKSARRRVSYGRAPRLARRPQPCSAAIRGGEPIRGIDVK